MDTQTLSKIWAEIESETISSSNTAQRKYRRLDLNYEQGIRIGCVIPDNTLELLIFIGNKNEYIDIVTPKWKGMRFEIEDIDVPEADSKHLRLFLISSEHKSVFITVCADLIRNIDKPYTAERRREEIEHFLHRWTRFFEHYGQTGLSSERQRGLLGELWWLNRMISENIDKYAAVDSWKGCKRNYHDFILDSHAVEVKTTMSKEPRKVIISNEKQLDNQGMMSLHLFVLSLQAAEEGGITLPNLINQIRSSLSDNESAKSVFESLLFDAGYLDVHAPDYSDHYTIRNEELFSVQDGFPRLTRIPAGLGDLKYSLLISACSKFQISREQYMKEKLRT